MDETPAESFGAQFSTEAVTAQAERWPCAIGAMHTGVGAREYTWYNALFYVGRKY